MGVLDIGTQATQEDNFLFATGNILNKKFSCFPTTAAVLEQTASESQELCRGTACSALPCPTRLCRTHLDLPSPCQRCSCRSFLSRETSWDCWKMQSPAGALSHFEGLSSSPVAVSFLLQTPYLAVLLHGKQCRALVLILPFPSSPHKQKEEGGTNIVGSW